MKSPVRPSFAVAPLALAALLLAGAAPPAGATSGPGCLRVVNVAQGDVLNMRAGASARSAIVDRLPPGRHGIIALRGPCIPTSRPWGQRWCPVTHSNGNAVIDGYVKARYVRDNDCP
ncbi:SH3 domain-containing protein [Stappia sp.]|uniref:SH3 domain-containing protein n=1 Tax=Stappia sp. TaxID=1870903 RepID=UPI0032D94915